jgi:hypothetical protein
MNRHRILSKHQFLELAPAGLDCGNAFGVHLTVEFQDLAAGISQTGPAATPGATPHGLDERFAKAAVHRADERPGAHIRHAQPGRGFGDGAGLFQFAQKLSLAGAKGDVLPGYDPQAWTDGSFILLVLRHDPMEICSNNTIEPGVHLIFFIQKICGVTASFPTAWLQLLRLHLFISFLNPCQYYIINIQSLVIP